MLPMFGGTKDKLNYHTWRCYVLGLKNNCYADNAFLTTVQNMLSGYAGEHYITIATRPHDPNHGSHLNQVMEDLDHHFGFSTNYDGMMSELYKMQQGLYELASFFGIRLE